MGPQTPKPPATTGADFQKHIDALFEMEEDELEEKEESDDGDKSAEDE